MKLKPLLRLEKTKPSEKKGWIAGIMISLEWEKTFGMISKWFVRMKK
jgi:hypothetical protein